jgi:tRNA (guanine-N7-)-methyltransferase
VGVSGEPVLSFHGRPSGGRSARSFTIRRGRRGPQKEHALAVLVPALSIPLASTPIDVDSVFGRSGPLIIDIGFGAGVTTLALAEAYPDANVLGIETHENGLAMLAHEVNARGVDNVRMVAGDAFDVLQSMIAKERAHMIQLVCPDPWPKPTQAHRRLFSPTFAALVAERLSIGGTLRLATDWSPYADQMLRVASSTPTLRNAHERFAPRDPARPVTTYERKGAAAGRSMRDLVFERV